MCLVAFGARIGTIFCVILYLLPLITAGFAQFILHGNLPLSALTTVLVAKPEWVEKVSGWMATWTNLIIKHCGFLRTAGICGLFYVVQGTLWMMYFMGIGDPRTSWCLA